MLPEIGSQTKKVRLVVFDSSDPIPDSCLLQLSYPEYKNTVAEEVEVRVPSSHFA